MRKAILIISLAMASSSAMAEWIEEPSSFLGIELGQPLSTSVSERCVRQSTPPQSGQCYDDRKRKDQDFFEVWGVRVSPLGYLIRIKTSDNTVDGTVGTLKVEFLSSNFSQVIEMLTIKFGLPHKREVQKLKTRGGAEFDDIVLTWSGEKVIIRADSLAARNYIGGSLLESASIVVFTTEYLNQKSKERSEAARKGAAGL